MFFFMVFNIFDIDSLAVFLNHLYLIVSDSGRQKRTCCLFLSSNISWISKLIDDYYYRADYCSQGQWGFLALSSIAAPIYVLHIRICHKVPLLRYDLLTL